MEVLLFGILFFLFVFSFFLPKKAGPTTYGSAKFEKRSKQLSWLKKGFLITRKALDVRTSCASLMLVGGSGSGKSQRHLIRQIFHFASSQKTNIIVLDPKQEVKELTEGYCQHKGYTTYTFNLIDPQWSHSWNCFDNIQEMDIEDIVARMYTITNQESEKNQEAIWSYGSKAIIALICKILFHYQQGQHLNLQNLHRLLSLLQVQPKKLLFWVKNNIDNDSLVQELRQFLSADDKIISGQLSGALSVVAGFLPEVAKRVTNVTTLPSLKKLRTDPCVIYIVTPIAKEEVFRPIISLYLSSMLNEIVNTPLQKHDRPLAMIFEEFAQCISIPNYISILATIRSRNCMIYHCIQAVEQLYKRYGSFEAETILANNHSYIIMPGLKSIKSQDFVRESLLGKTTITRKNKDGNFENHSSRYLMTNDEIRKLDSELAIFVCGNDDPVLISPKPLYRDWWLKWKYGLRNSRGKLESKYPTLPYVNSDQETYLISLDDEDQNGFSDTERALSFQERLEVILKQKHNG